MDHKPEPTESTEGKRKGALKKTNEHLANDRTGLAWIRTGLGIIGIGFVISRFGLLLRAQARPELPPSTIHYSTLLGLVWSSLACSHSFSP